MVLEELLVALSMMLEELPRGVDANWYAAGSGVSGFMPVLSWIAKVTVWADRDRHVSASKNIDFTAALL
jgi:hypothetical protein